MNSLIDLDMSEAAERDMAQFMKNHPRPPMVETPLVVNMGKVKATMKKARQELQLINPPPAMRDKMYMSIMDAVKEDLSGMLAEEGKRIDGEIQKEAEAWHRERRLNPARFDAQNAEQALRYKAMTADEIKHEAAELMERPRPIEPRLVDELSVELKNVDPELHGKFRGFVKEARVYEPWRFTDNGKKLSTYEAAIQKGQKEGDVVPAVLENGQVIFESVSNILGGGL